MLSLVISLISGMIFSAGLVISGMTNPAKVIGFLDIFGEWDYSLALVMGGAVGINLLSNFFLKNKKPIFSDEKYLPTTIAVDKKLVVGSIMFGIGWGLIGICPGPAVVNLVLLNPASITFVISMFLGMLIYKGVKTKI